MVYYPTNEIFIMNSVGYADLRSEVAFSTKSCFDIEYTEDISDFCEELAEQWISDCRFMSSLDEITSHVAYQKIIAIGEAALPFIFYDLENAPKPWFVALRKITGENPIARDKAGNFEHMRTAWLEWAKSNGY